MTTAAHLAGHAAFLARILENPDDDSPRLVYADWLQERGGTVPCGRCAGEGCTFCGGEDRDYHTACNKCPTCAGYGRLPDAIADRAEFIRVQCELAKLERANEAAVGVTVGAVARGIRIEALRARERELLEAHWRAWSPDGAFWFCKNLREDADVAGRSAVTFRRGFVEAVTLTAAAASRANGAGAMANMPATRTDRNEPRSAATARAAAAPPASPRHSSGRRRCCG